MFARNKRSSTLFRSVTDVYYATSLTVANAATATVTSTTTSNVYIELQNDVGGEINLILDALTTGGDDLSAVLASDSYDTTITKLTSYTNTGTDNASKTFEEYRKLLVYALEAAKQASIRQQEQTVALAALQLKYELALSQNSSQKNVYIFGESASLTTAAQISPEIIEYVRRGYKIADDFGELIPIDEEVMAAIRSDLNL